MLLDSAPPLPLYVKLKSATHREERLTRYEYMEEREVANEQFWLGIADREGVWKQFHRKIRIWIQGFVYFFKIAIYFIPRPPKSEFAV
jgi:hypothetical protein